MEPGAVFVAVNNPEQKAEKPAPSLYTTINPITSIAQPSLLNPKRDQ
jgi:hypothetical protein